MDILFKNAKIIDGTGSPAYVGCVGIEKDKIALVKAGDLDCEAASVIDVTGLICCPGFIDIHSHADISIPLYSEAYSLLVQGITTFVGGNCGISLAPATKPDYYEKYNRENGLSIIDFQWGGFGKWLDHIDARGVGANYVPLVGHNAIRGNVLGADYNRFSTEAEVKEELLLLEEALDAGAFGMSAGFDAAMAGHSADRTEIEALFSLLERKGALITAHTRHHQNQWPSDDGRTYYGVYNGYRGDVICGRYHGFIEFMEYYKRFPKLRVLISHLTNAFLMPQPHSQALENAMIDETLRLLVDEPLQEGYDVYYNLLPSEISISSRYRVTFSLAQSLQYDTFFKDYTSEMDIVKGLCDTGFRLKLIELINSGRFKMGMLSPATDPYWADCYTFVRSNDISVVGKTLMEVTQERKTGTQVELVYCNCMETLFDIVLDDPNTEWALTKDKREYMAYQRLLLHPRSMPCTDCIAFPEVPDTTKNMLSYGTPPVGYTMMCRYLINMARDKQHLSPEEAIRRITSLPAQVMGIEGRGKLTEGYSADITLLNWDGLSYENDFLSPSKRPGGFVHVLVNGQFAMKDSVMQKAAAGRVIRK